MTTWSVVKDDIREKRWHRLVPRFLPRIALLACIAAVVVSLGMAMIPNGPQQPGEPPFSEQARAAALSDVLRLRAAGEQLGASAAAAGQPAVGATVTLLTSQGRALLGPGQTAMPTPPAPSAQSPAQSPAQPSAQPSDAGAGAAASPPALLPDSAAGLAAALAASGSQRIADAAAADGGMARLLAAVGTGQLLQASSLAAAAGATLPPHAGAAPLPSTETCPTATSSPSPGGGAAGGAVTLAAALEAALRTERRSIYGYQLALTRLGGDTAKAAAEQLGHHRTLAGGAEAWSRHHCYSPPLEEAGYTVGPSFLASPAAGLAAVETAALPVYGDLVALSEGETRQWAISALLGAARRASLWGAAPGPVPGLAVDAESFPTLPAPGPSASPSRSQAG